MVSNAKLDFFIHVPLDISCLIYDSYRFWQILPIAFWDDSVPCLLPWPLIRFAIFYAIKL